MFKRKVRMYSTIKNENASIVKRSDTAKDCRLKKANTEQKRGQPIMF